MERNKPKKRGKAKEEMEALPRLLVGGTLEKAAMTRILNDALEERVTEVCRGIAASHQSQAIAASLHGPWVCGYANQESSLHVLLVLSDYLPQLRAYDKTSNKISLFILAVDQKALERDVGRGWLGEFVAQQLTFPYVPLTNEDYLRLQEVKVKKRIVSELLENLILEFPELSHELHILPDYFMYESMMRKARLFPPLAFTFLNMLRKPLKERNIESMMKGYQKALSELKDENKIQFDNGYVKITSSFVKATKSQKLRVPDFLKSLQKTILLHLLNILPKMTQPLLHDEELFSESDRKPKAEDPLLQLEDPQKFLLISTPLGFVTVSDKTSIKEFVKKAVPGSEVVDMKIEKIGGVLNDVYLLRVRKDHKEQKVVVKRFIDWSGFKWFPLALWTLGTKRFAVFGRSRLERQYAINQFLRSHGFPVPTILHLSLEERLIFEEFVEGEESTEIVKRIISSHGGAPKEADLVKEVGRRMAEAHKLGVSLGDTKPENILVSGDGNIYFVDFEQATRDGDQVWDVAEFLYYSGHYIPPVSPARAAEVITKEFINGYLEAGGKEETIRRAASTRYTKVFSIFTPLHVILAISNVCKKMSSA